MEAALKNNDNEQTCRPNNEISITPNNSIITTDSLNSTDNSLSTSTDNPFNSTDISFSFTNDSFNSTTVTSLNSTNSTVTFTKNASDKSSKTAKVTCDASIQTDFVIVKQAVLKKFKSTQTAKKKVKNKGKNKCLQTNNTMFQRHVSTDTNNLGLYSFFLQVVI